MKDEHVENGKGKVARKRQKHIGETDGQERINMSCMTWESNKCKTDT